MIVILVLLPLGILFAGAFLAGFFWAVRSGQYEDTCTPALRVLSDDSHRAALPTHHSQEDQPSH